MSKESKDDSTIVVLIGLIIIIFTLAIGIVIGVFAVSEPDASNLTFWSSLGDALNPFIGFISALLVAAGLIYTARDFRLARQEFEASRVELVRANEISERKFTDERREKEGLDSINRIEVLIERIQNFRIISPLPLKFVAWRESHNKIIKTLTGSSKDIDCFMKIIDRTSYDSTNRAYEYSIDKNDLYIVKGLIKNINLLMGEIQDFINYDGIDNLNFKVDLMVLSQIYQFYGIKIISNKRGSGSSEVLKTSSEDKYLVSLDNLPEQINTFNVGLLHKIIKEIGRLDSMS